MLFAGFINYKQPFTNRIKYKHSTTKTTPPETTTATTEATTTAASMGSKKYLALDLSTQSLKALVTTEDLEIVFEHTIK